MAKLLFKQEFTLEVGEDTYKGILNDLTKTQKIAFEKINKQKKADNEALRKSANQLKKLDRKIEVKEKLEKWEEVEHLEEQKEVLEKEIEGLTEKLSDEKAIEDMFKKRLEYSIESDDKDQILEAGKNYGYQNVFQTILKDIEDKSEKK